MPDAAAANLGCGIGPAIERDGGVVGRVNGRIWGGSASTLVMRPAVIDGLDPGSDQPVQLEQVGDAKGFDLDEELDAHRGEEPFDLPSALRLAWSQLLRAMASLGIRLVHSRDWRGLRTSSS